MFQVISIRVKHFPSIIIAVVFVLFAVGIVHVTFYEVFFGVLVSWIHIRFFKVQDGIRGDRSETFAFASFFPQALHPFIIPVSNSTFNFLVKMNIFPPLSAVPPASAINSTSTMSELESGKFLPKPLPGSEMADAERRRAIALRALDLRLQEKSGKVAAAGGSASSSSLPMLGLDEGTPSVLAGVDAGLGVVADETSTFSSS
ncbi:hypothetical protein HDV05_001248 [Chytridiales sp. JEL 0842]|nr:hypothetical protein HDV05_001248 [Chytridiales sp. JEL 0842]